MNVIPCCPLGRSVGYTSIFIFRYVLYVNYSSFFIIQYATTTWAAEQQQQYAFFIFYYYFPCAILNRYSWKNSYQDAFISIASKVALFLNTMICVCVSKRHSLPLILCACEIYNIEAQLENKLCRAAWILHLQSHFSVINGVQTDLRLSYLEDITSLLETSFFCHFLCVYIMKQCLQHMLLFQAWL